VDVDEVVAYAHKVSYTTSAPPNWNPNLPHMRMFLPPAPQEINILQGNFYHNSTSAPIPGSHHNQHAHTHTHTRATAQHTHTHARTHTLILRVCGACAKIFRTSRAPPRRRRRTWARRTWAPDPRSPCSSRCPSREDPLPPSSPSPSSPRTHLALRVVRVVLRVACAVANDTSGVTTGRRHQGWRRRQASP
jgi:hypothetical protein